MFLQAEVNIGTLGHVDHGKTTLTKNLTGVWTDTHSEEIKRGITIKLGYADAVFRKCERCEGHNSYTIQERCPICGSETKVLRKVSFLDAPGHETLMTTAIAASSIIDGALLVIAANEPCPQPQTMEHFAVLEILGIKNIVVIQNKVDLVSKAKALENYEQIRKFLSGTFAENAPIIPTAANYGINTGAIIEAIEEHIPTPKRNLSAKPLMFVARSFDVNKPGIPIEKMKGGVVGGSLIRGKLKVGDEVEIRPGIYVEEKDKHKSIRTKIQSLHVGSESIEEAGPGGLVAIGTTIDPAYTKADRLVGNLVGLPDALPPIFNGLVIEANDLKRVDITIPPIKLEEGIVVCVGTTTVL
ncbi:MAG: translation initiation factor IF-2 subunit gamma, partial [Candidatus Micrarchaeia archaeon]